jgi:DNA-binding CsgD family transcriptional regulator
VYLKKIYELASYLSSDSKSLDEVAQFITLKTLNGEQSSAVFFAKITSDAHLVPIAAFGQEKFAITKMSKIPLSARNPLTDAVKTDKWIHIKKPEDFLRDYPDLIDFENVSLGPESVVAWPMLPFGAALTTLGSNRDLDDNFQHFLKVISEMVHLYHRKLDYKSGLGNKSSSPGEEVSMVLTRRQNLIVELLRLGKTNVEIAEKLGYSESLIRQETVKIYRNLGISGRKDLVLENDSI